MAQVTIQMSKRNFVPINIGFHILISLLSISAPCDKAVACVLKFTVITEELSMLTK